MGFIVRVVFEYLRSLRYPCVCHKFCLVWLPVLGGYNY